MKRHAHIPKLLWYVLLSVLFVSLLLLSACDSNDLPSETTAESVEQTAEAPTEKTPDGTEVLVPAIPVFVTEVVPGEYVRMTPIDGMFENSDSDSDKENG